MTERMHYLDTLRAAMMVMGIAFHAGLIYSVNSNWIVTDTSQSELITWITYWLHVFRMPAFFIVAGFFCAFLYHRVGKQAFIKARLSRLGIPLVATAITLNLGQFFIVRQLTAENASVISFFTTGEYLQHLWFLVNLLIYTLLYLTAAQIFKVAGKSILKKIAALTSHMPAYLLALLLPVATLGIYASNKVGFPLYSTVFSAVSVFMVMLYLPYFLFGLAIYYSPEMYRRWITAPLLPVAILCVCLFAAQSVIERTLTEDTMVYEVLSVYLSTSLSWLMSVLIFSVFYRYFQHPSAWGRRISEASYTIYLFHHVIVIALGIAFLNWQVPALIKYVTICVATFFITIVIHEKVINQNRVLKWTFSGIWVSRYLRTNHRAKQSR